MEPVFRRIKLENERLQVKFYTVSLLQLRNIELSLEQQRHRRLAANALADRSRLPLPRCVLQMDEGLMTDAQKHPLPSPGACKPLVLIYKVGLPMPLASLEPDLGSTRSTTTTCAFGTT